MGALGRIANSSPGPQNDYFSGLDRRWERYAMQSHIRHLLADRHREIDPLTGEITHGLMLKKQTFRVCRCSRFVVPKKSSDGLSSNVELLISAEHERAHFGNLETCSSVWICPVCAAKIAERRRQELRQVIDAAKANGYQVVMLTMTLRHAFGDDLEGLRDGLLGALSRFKKQHFTEFKTSWGWVGDVRVIELTHGLNGWHPHVHMLVFLRSPLSADRLENFGAACAARWQTALQAAGYDCLLDRGCQLDSTDKRIADYIAKFDREPSLETLENYGRWGAAEELSMSTNKRGRLRGLTPWELVLDSMAGDFNAGQLFKNYAKVTKGKRQMEWSRSPDMRDIFGVEQKTDAQITDEKIDSAVLLASLDWQDWRAVLRQERRAELLKQAEFAYQTNDLSLLSNYLNSLKNA